ncbi:MAG: type I-E CRISPR-associated protein Cas7/Cse4/CasC [Deltaproteobacteria bacterium]|nr:type I-E CRISPR-associated protein Cas7/Cse4/CasC [Deltaproteobacteria bacterium]
MNAKFLQIHSLTSYPASLLNRDDAGFAKRMPFGGAVRTRISSQCLKRHWRVFEGEDGFRNIEAPDSVRSRIAFERFLVEPLKAEGVPEELARSAGQKIVAKVLGSEQKKEKAEKNAGNTSAKKRSKKSGDGEDDGAHQADAGSTRSSPLMTAQVTVLGRPELDYLCGLARAALTEAEGSPAKVSGAIDRLMKNEKELKKNIQALLPGSLEAGLGAALFGRMVTGDVLARTDAAIHVAHALTVHAQMSESDYFSAIDDLQREEGEQGSGHINASELTSGVFYGYVVVDVEGLSSNLGEDRGLVGDVVARLVRMIPTVSPGAKLGSTAPYAYSHLVMVESGSAQPRSLVNAFLEPVRTSGHLVRNAYAALSEHLSALDGMYGWGGERAHAALSADALFENPMNLASLADWSRKQVSP